MSETAQILPLPKVTGIWRHDSSKYPEEIRVPMSDGKVIRYHIDVEQPHPCFLAAMDNIKNLEGYKYEGTV